MYVITIVFAINLQEYLQTEAKMDEFKIGGQKRNVKLD